MRIDMPGHVAIICLLVSIPVSAAEPARSPADQDPVAAELEKLGTEYQKLLHERQQLRPPDGAEESDAKLSDEEWLRQERELQIDHPGPDEIVLPRILSLAKSHPQSPFALDALAFLIRRGGYHTGDVQGEPWRIKEQALDLVEQHHMADPRVVHIFTLVSGSLPSHKEEAFLRRAFASAPTRAARAAAGFSLAKYFNTISTSHARSQQIERQSKVANNERFWKIVVAPYLNNNFPYDEEKLSAEIERALARVIDEYGDVPATDLWWSGPTQVFLHTEPLKPPKTYGDLAKSLWFERNSLAPGKQAPEIVGTDASGEPFRLSDYRGKVVLLTFSADWCGGCVQLYPLERTLVEKFGDQPFALLSVSRDETIDTLKASIASGDITWRCWWDGTRGPITEAWNIQGVPTIYLLDHRGIIQDVRLSRATPPEEFERSIAELIAKAAQDKEADR